MRELFGFPSTASGLFVTGTSMANFIALLVARTAHLGSRRNGRIGGRHASRLYVGCAHGCLAKACDMAGLGSGALQKIPVNRQHQIDLNAPFTCHCSRPR